MKKLLAAAVAATMSVSAMADISITGDAEFSYDSTTTNDGTSKTTVNNTNTDANLYVRGKTGDTSVVLDFNINTDDNATAGDALVVEDAYVKTKLGPIGAKVGNYSSSTSGILGEIEEGGRALDKMTFDYTVNGVQFYAGNSGEAADGGADGSYGEEGIKGSMFVGVVATVEGWKLQAKKNDNTKNSFGVSGQAGPVGIRVEYSDGKNDDNTGYFANFTGKFDNINVGLAMIDMKEDGDIAETDSAIFAVENAGNGDSNTQLSASITVDGTKYGAKIGKIGFVDSATNDRKYYQIKASRDLASGVNAAVSYTDKETSNTADSKNFSVDVTVAF
jgi:hypothetical protein